MMPEQPRIPAAHDFDTSDEVNLQDLGSALWRNRWLIAAITFVAVGIGALAARYQQPVYESSALLRIVPSDQGFDLGSSSSSMKLLLGLENTGDLQTSVGILESRRIAEAIVDSLALQVVLRQPNTPRERVLSVLEAPSTARPATFDLRRAGDGSYSLTSSLPGATQTGIRPGEPFRAGELLLRLNPELASAPPARIRLEIRPYQKTVRELQKSLAISQSGGGSQLVRLRYRHTDSLLVAAVPNIAAARFIEYKTQTSSFESNTTLGFLRQQADDYQRDLRSAEGRLQGFLEHSGIVEPKTEAETRAKRLAELMAERETMERERTSLAALVRQIEASPRTPDQPSPYRQLVAFPSFFANNLVQNILHSIIEQETERSALMVLRTERNADVLAKTRRIQEMESELHQLARNYLSDTERRLAALNATLGRFTDEITRLPAREVELRRLSREAALLEQIHQTVEVKLKEEEIRAAAQFPNVQVVDPAVVPDESEFPRPLLYLFFSGILGLFVGSGAAVLRSRSNPTVNSRQDVFAATAGLPVLAAIDLPRRQMEEPNGRRRLLARLQNGSGRPFWIGTVWPSRSPQPRTGAAAGVAPPLLSLVGPAHRLADSYRALRTNVGLLDQAGTAGGVLVLAGTDAGDDTALTAANLAIAYAQQGSRVVLVDADLRAGSLHSLFGVEKEPGLTEALQAGGSIEAVAREVSAGAAGAALHLVCSGSSKQNPADVVGSAAMVAFVEQLRARYEHVVLVAPAVNAAPDASIIARVADRALLVVTTGSTTRPSLEAAARQLQHLRVPVEGVVMNGSA